MNYADYIKKGNGLIEVKERIIGMEKDLVKINLSMMMMIEDLKKQEKLINNVLLSINTLLDRK